MLISKGCSLMHFWNVFSPMSDDLDRIRDSNFDDNIFQDNQFICVNVKKSALENKGFRMNERIFREIETDDAFGVKKK